jgi:hypothetical protein
MSFRSYRGISLIPRLLWTCRNMIKFLRWRVLSTSLNPRAGEPPLVGCPRLLIQYIRSYPLYLQAVPPPATWVRAMPPWWQKPTWHDAMPWWQGPTWHGVMPWWQGPTCHGAMPWWQGPTYHGVLELEYVNIWKCERSRDYRHYFESFISMQILSVARAA